MTNQIYEDSEITKDSEVSEDSEISINLSPDPTLVITDDSGTRKISLVADKYTIGRESDNHVCLKSDFVSRYHATLIKVRQRDRSDTYRIIDGSDSGKPSKNGIVLNALRKIYSHRLQNGDIITFAPEVHILYLAPTVK